MPTPKSKRLEGRRSGKGWEPIKKKKVLFLTLFLGILNERNGIKEKIEDKLESTGGGGKNPKGLRLVFYFGSSRDGRGTQKKGTSKMASYYSSPRTLGAVFVRRTRHTF